MLSTIGNYKLEKLLGEGGFGKVYLAFDPHVGQPVAIKKLRAGGDADLLRRFTAEIRTTASLRHKNIVTIHASGEEAGDPYLVMEFLEGRTLKQIVQERVSLTLLEKVKIMTQVAEGLAYAHSKGVVHRDVKPENIMLLADETVKIMDFGIALGPDQTTAVTQTGGIVGTPPYFAPEQIEGFKACEQTDIFSFGDVYYELLTGIHPFEQFKNDWKSLQFAILTFEPQSVGELVPGCPEALETLVHRALAKAPEYRYQAFEELRLDNEAILVDLRQERAAAILREVRTCADSGDFRTAKLKVDQAYQMAPGNRDVRRLREEINQLVQKDQMKSRVAGLMADAERHIIERRYAEAVQSLELGVKLDSTNVPLAGKLAEAKARLDQYVTVNRLVAEARYHHQKGSLDEAHERLEEALSLDREQTDARRLSLRVQEELERRRLDRQCQEAVRGARERLGAGRLAEALAVLDELERQQPGAAGAAELREEILREQAERARRRRAERFNLALTRTREALQAGDLERATPMVDHLFANFPTEPGAQEVFPELRQRLDALVRAREIAQYEQKARGLVEEKALPEAVALLTEALREFPGDPGLEQLSRSAEELYRAQQRSEAIAAVLNEANTSREAGDLQKALNAIQEGRKRLGDEAAFVDLARHLELEIEQHRYSAGLESLLNQGRECMAAGKYAEALERIERAKEYSGEAEVRALLDAARAAAAAELERRTVEETLTAADGFQSREAWNQALEAVERGLVPYPRNLHLTQAADRLRARIEQDRRRSAIERHRAAISFEIENGEWKKAEAALRQARSEFPGDSFNDLADQVEAGSYDARLREVMGQIRGNLAANAFAQAEQTLNATRSVYARDPRWKALGQEVARQREYEAALLEADRQRQAGELTAAESLLVKTMALGAPDQRADQMRTAIRAQRSEADRQQEIAPIAQGIRECLERGDLERAASELAAASARHPGESVWAELQADLDARQQSLRRQTDLAVAEQGVRQPLASDDIREAQSRLIAARGKFPGEPVWTSLEAEIDARQAVLKRAEIAAVAERIRGWLLQRPEGLPQAVAELDAARAKYPGEDLWSTLQAEIEARRAYLDGEAKLAERVDQSLERGDLAEAGSQLNAARANYPDEDFWGMYLMEIDHCRGIRDSLQRGDLEGAQAELDSSRARYPNETVWPTLQAEIDARRKSLERAGVIAEVRQRVGPGLDEQIGQAVIGEAQRSSGTYPIAPVWDLLRDAGTRLVEARSQYPGESVWDDLGSEMAQRQTRIESEITEIVRSCSGALPLDRNATQLTAARILYPGEPFWVALEAEIAARRAELEQAQAQVKRREELDAIERKIREQLQRVVETSGQPALTDPLLLQWEAFEKAAAVLAEARARYRDEGCLVALSTEIGARRAAWEQEIQNALQGHPDVGVLQWYAPQIRALGTKAPHEPLWARLASDVDALEALLNRQADVAAAGEPVRASMSRDDMAQASAELNASPAKSPDEDLWAALEAEIAARQGLVEQRRREPRNRDRDLLLAIERQVEGESNRRKRRALADEARRIAAPYGDDPEIAPIAARIHARIEAPPAPATPKPVPWKSIGFAAGATVALAVALIVWLHKPHKPIPVSTIPFEIRTDPVGASVRVGDRSCVTPNCRLDLTPGRSYQVVAELQDHETARQTVVVYASHPQLDLTLWPVGVASPPAEPVAAPTDTQPNPLQSAHMELTGAPANLELRLDGKPFGQADGSAKYAFPDSVKPGDHVLWVAQGTLQPARGPGGQLLKQRFLPGQTVRLAWKPDATPPPAAGPIAPVPTPLEQDWAKVQDTSNPDLLRDFRKRYPNSTHDGAAFSTLDRLVWSGTKKDSVESLRAYLRELPDGGHVPEAGSLLTELTWKGVDQDDPEQLHKFIDANPNSPYLATAQKILSQVTARRATWDREISDILKRFNSALVKKQDKQMKALWPSVSQTFLKPQRRATYELACAGNPTVTGDRARAPCSLILHMSQPKSDTPQPVTVELRNLNGQWRIENIN